MSLSEREVNTIHSNTVFVDGQKYFGEYDNKVTSKPTTERILGNQDLRSSASIFIPVMERAEKLDTFLASLKVSIEASGHGVSLVVLDNSIERKLLQQIKDFDFGSSVTEIYYHHDPRMTQASGRNHAFKNLSSGSGVIGIWDSDIYASKGTVGNLINSLLHSGVSGIAPPLGKYGGGSQEVALSVYKNIRTNINSRLKLHMPGEIGEANGVWNGDILRTTMMRGSFFVKRDLIDGVARANSEGNPWLKDFILWQNVPFFISARELDFDFGYLMQGDTVVLHDDRVDKLSVGYSLEYRTNETLKSIFMLMYRNNVYGENGRKINSKFLEYNVPAIMRVTGFDKEKATRFQDFILNATIAFNLATSVSDFKVDVPDEFKDVSQFLELLKYEPVFSRVKKIKSTNPSRVMYTV